MGPAREWWVGILFFAGLVALIFVTIYLSDVTFRRGMTLEVVFESVKGLREGDDVNIAGMRVGSVRTISYLPERRVVRVILWLRQSVILREGYAVQINASTLLGGNAVDIDPGPPEAPEVRTDRELRGETPVEMIRSFGRVVAQAEENLGEILQNLRDITERLKAGEGTIGKLLAEEGPFEKLDRMLDDYAAIGDDLRAKDGELGRMLLGEKGRDDLGALLADMRGFSEDLDKGEGTLQTLLRDKTLYDDIQTAVRNFREFSDSLEGGGGTLGLLLHDEATRDEVRQIIADIRDITEKMKGGEGSLGKLLTSNELHDELLRAVEVLTGAIEDARESAPLNTFTAALFTAF